MAEDDRLNYGRLMQRALRGLMSEVLGHVAEHGLPGDHHFYIGIDTTHPGVDIADWLKARYPREMTIVIQEWFADLAVLGDRFRVTLNFSDQPETLVIPFDAVKTFIDPSVRFGLKFDEEDDDADDDAVFEPSEAAEETRRPAAADDGESGNGDDDPDGGGSAEIVRLDRFRNQ